MDAKISFVVLGVVAVVSLISESPEGKNVLIFKKPFFSTDIKKSKTFKDQFIATRSEHPSAYTKSFNGSRYKFVDSCQGVTRSAAQSDCERDSSYLVFIETKQENDFLINEASRNTTYWIGLFSPKRHLFWDNGNQVTFVNLDRENWETFNDSSGCFKMSNTDGRYWLDNTCAGELGFICEYEGSTCPYNFTENYDNSCYNFVNDFPLSRFTAQSKCENDSAHLVFIESKEENEFLVRTARKGIEYWIGLEDRPQLFWDNGKQVTFANIDQSKVNSFFQRTGCYRMSKKKGERRWRSRSCKTNYSYICEYTERECLSGNNGPFNRSCYNFFNSKEEKTTRFLARSNCESNSSHLVFIESKEESDFLDEHAENETRYWIGLFSPTRHLFWDDGNQVTFASLDQENQDTFDDRTGCYKMSTTNGRYWLDRSCGEELGFICEYEGSGCPYGAVHSFNNSCYKFFNESPSSRFSAQLKCENDSSHLVFIESKEENDFLVGKAQDDTDYWIGLHDRPQLFWDDGKQVTYANIDAEQNRTFDNREAGCYQMSDHEGGHFWYDHPCDGISGYICEYEG